MNSRERMLTAISGGQPDRVPMYDWIDEEVVWGMAERLGLELPARGQAVARYGEEPIEVLDLFCDVVETLDIDSTWLVHSTGFKRTSEEFGEDKYGRRYILSDMGLPAVVEGPINSLRDAERYDMAARLTLEDFAGARHVMERLGPDRACVLSIYGPFKESWLMRGSLEKYLIDFVADPELVHAIARITTDFNKKVIDISAEIGVDIIKLTGDLAGNDYLMMSPQHYREFNRPYKKEIVDHAHAKGLKVLKHSDGNMWSLVDDLVEIGFDGFHPIQPQCMDLAQTKAHLGDRISLCGNVDCLDLLVFGEPDQVEAETRRVIEIAAPGGGFVLCSSNSLHPGCKPENVIAMFRACRKYGDYAMIEALPPAPEIEIPLDALAKRPPRAPRLNRRRHTASLG